MGNLVNFQKMLEYFLENRNIFSKHWKVLEKNRKKMLKKQENFWENRKNFCQFSIFPKLIEIFQEFFDNLSKFSNYSKTFRIFQKIFFEFPKSFWYFPTTSDISEDFFEFSDNFLIFLNALIFLGIFQYVFLKKFCFFLRVVLVLANLFSPLSFSTLANNFHLMFHPKTWFMPSPPPRLSDPI